MALIGLDLRMMDNGLTDAQKELHQYMSDISEFAYFARWMTGTEYRLWAFMTDANDNGDWGRDAALTAEMRAELLRLSETIGGWIHWVWAFEQAESGPQFITAVDWQKKYAMWASELALAKKHLPRRYIEYSKADGLAYWAALQELTRTTKTKGNFGPSTQRLDTATHSRSNPAQLDSPPADCLTDTSEGAS